MVSSEELRNILEEKDREKRDAMIEALSERDAKDIIKSFADFLRRWDKI